MKKRILVPSTFLCPVLSDSMFFYKDLSYRIPISNVSDKAPNLISQLNPNDLVVELRLLEATGLPIPQNSIKNTILSRSINISFFDTSQ